MSWQRCKRWLGWFVFVAALIGLGFGVFHLQPAEPLWEVSSRTAGIHYSPDGRSLFVASYLGLDDQPLHQSDGDRFVLEVRDTWTGRITARYPRVGELSGNHVFSGDNRFFAAECKRKKPGSDKSEPFICLVDLASGAEREIALSPGESFAWPHFSPCRKYLAGFEKSGQKESEAGLLTIYDVPTGAALDKRPSLKSLWNVLMLELSFAGDDLLHVIPAKENTLEQWSLLEKRAVATIEFGGFFPVVSKDKKFLLITKIDEKFGGGTWLVWNLIGRKWQASFPLENPSETAVIAPNSQWVAISGARGVALRELATGKKIFFGPGEYTDIIFSPDSQILISQTKCGLIGLRLPTMEKLWEMPSSREAPVFTEDSRRLIFLDDHVCRICDSSTGEVTRKITLPPTKIVSSGLSIQNQSLLIECNTCKEMLDWPPDDTWWRRTLKKFHIILDDADSIRNDVIIVYDLAADCEKMRLVRQDVHTAALSPDGAILVTRGRGPEHVLRGWDVARPKPFRFALAAPVGVGVLLLSLRTLWRRWRARKQAPA